VIAGACVAVGGALLWAWLDPVSLGASRPAHLVALLGLFTLPSATMALWTMDERRRGRAGAWTPAAGSAAARSARRHPARGRVARRSRGRRPAMARRI